MHGSSNARVLLPARTYMYNPVLVRVCVGSDGLIECICVWIMALSLIMTVPVDKGVSQSCVMFHDVGVRTCGCIMYTWQLLRIIWTLLKWTAGSCCGCMCSIGFAGVIECILMQSDVCHHVWPLLMTLVWLNLQSTTGRCGIPQLHC